MLKPEFNETIHSSTRLAIMSLMSSTSQIYFKYVRDTLEISDSVLSKQIAILEEAKYVKVKKMFIGKKPSTWFSLTNQGRKAYDQHILALKELTGF